METTERESIEAWIIVCLAGYEGARRSKQGSAPGWFRFRSKTEVTAWHEGAHAVCANACGLTVYSASIIPRGEYMFKNTLVLAKGWCEIMRPKCIPDPPDGREEHELQTAARLCHLLAGEGDWKTTTRKLRQMRARTRDLVNQNARLIGDIAFELQRLRDLDSRMMDLLMNAPRRKTFDFGALFHRQGGPAPLISSVTPAEAAA
jgi:hypothetical protein